jgi:hypothetical protein
MNAEALTDFFTFSGNPGQPGRSPESLGGRPNCTGGSLCFSQGDHWVHLGGAPGWKIAGQNGDGKQERRHNHKHRGIMQAHPVKQTAY